MAVVGAYGYTPTDDEIIEPGLSPAGVLTVWNQFKTAINTIDLAQMNTNSVGSDQIVALAVTTAKIAADAIDATKIADDAIDSEHYVDGSIDTAHIADDQVTAAKMAHVFAVAQDDDVASDTITETAWHDVAGVSKTVILPGTSNVLVIGQTGYATHDTNTATVYLRVVYDTTAAADAGTAIGSTQRITYEDVSQDKFPLMAFGVKSALAADTYYFKLQAKTSSGTWTVANNNISVMVIPYTA